MDNIDVLRRLTRLEDQTQTHAELIAEVRVSLARISTSLETMVSLLRWAPALVGMVGALATGLVWFISHVK